MKNVIIVGPSRAGKTTLAKRLHGFTIYDTSTERESVLDKIIEDISKC